MAIATTVLKGQSLKQLREQTARLTQETGFYAGIEELTLKEQDPLKFEVFHSRLLAAVIAGRETTRMVAASPLVREVAELLVCLYTPEGDCVVQSTGIQVHALVGGRQIRWLIDNDYEQTVGIEKGDIFTCNDNAIAGMHPADVFDFLPIFYENELVGWTSTVIMEVEIGAVWPGNMPSANVERYSDGLRICAEKTGEDYLLRRDFEVRCQRTLRMPDSFLLDRKGAIAADIKVEQEVAAIIDEFGLDYFKRAIKELIEDERRAQIARMRERTVPGRYRVLCWQDVRMSELPVPEFARSDVLRLTPLEMSILPNGYGIIDFEGAGAWGWHSMNGTPSAMEGGLSISLGQRLSYEGKANLGTLLPWDIKVPYDTILDPSKILYLPTANLWAPTINIWGTWHSLISRAFFARGFREEIVLGQPRTSGMEFGGFGQYGTPFAWINFELAGAQGSGARAIMDGIDVGMHVWNAEVDTGSIEVFELAWPNLQLGRTLSPDSGGSGKYRGGADLTGTYMIHKSSLVVAQTQAVVATYRVLPNTSVYGGYSGPNAYWTLLTESNIEELIEQRKPLPHREGSPHDPDITKLVRGKGEQVKTLVNRLLKEGDLAQNCYHSANGGYGDPIERDTGLIRRDLDNGITTPEAARRIYCAAVGYDVDTDEWRVDEAETQQLREARRKERLARGVPVKDWWKQQRARVLKKDLDPMVMECFNSSMQLNSRWAEEYRRFWALPDDFSY